MNNANAATKTNRIRPLILTTDGRLERLVAVSGTKADGTAAEPVFGLYRGGIVPGSDLDRCLAAIEARFVTLQDTPLT